MNVDVADNGNIDFAIFASCSTLGKETEAPYGQ